MAKTRSKPRKKPAPTDDLNPWSVELVRYLARWAAERKYEALRKGHDQPEHPPAGRKEAT